MDDIKITEEVKQDKNEFDKIEKVERELLSLSFGLLGEFAEDGSYKVKQDKFPSLLGMAKVMTAVDGNFIFAKAKLGKFTLKFQVELFEISAYEAGAKLFLSEEIDDGDEFHKLLSFVAGYKDRADVLFKDKVKKAFNIFDSEDDGKEISNDDIAKDILEKLSTSKSKFDSLSAVIELQSEIYLIRMLKTLLGCGEAGTEILAKYDEYIKKNSEKLKPGNKSIYTKLKKVLDKEIEKKGGRGKLSEKQEIKKICDEFVSTKQKAVENLTKKDEPKAKEKSSKKIVKKAAAESKKKEVKSAKKKESKKAETKKEDDKGLTGYTHGRIMAGTIFTKTDPTKGAVVTENPVRTIVEKSQNNVENKYARKSVLDKAERVPSDKANKPSDKANKPSEDKSVFSDKANKPSEDKSVLSKDKTGEGQSL